MSPYAPYSFNIGFNVAASEEAVGTPVAFFTPSMALRFNVAASEEAVGTQYV